ncbi:MAG: cobyrinate a,c-diamide synthase [Chloroflexi bacterium]|nr:cobyrinate a,c-diamide synthase [Chloroflexota bacterium]
MDLPRLVLGGTSSGVGKTTLACGLLAALHRRGLRVQPFKAGPDYIDPGYHTLAAGRPSRNLDTWLLSRSGVVECFARAAAGVDLALIEGVMGLYDGVGGRDEAGSTAELAKILGAPVLLVVDAASTPRSIAATVLGFQQFDRDLRLAGVLVTGLESAEHQERLAAAVQAATGLPVLGGLPRREDFRLPERHLGLVPTVASPPLDEFLERLAAQVEESIDLDALLRLARSAPALSGSTADGVFPERPIADVTLGVALDEAFSFYYHDNLDLLTAWGARLVPFSPLRDRSLPPGVSGLYLGGGFPEVYARVLADNVDLLTAVRQAAAAGMPIYAECGGMMYLSEGIVDLDEMAFPMVGLVPGLSIMQPGRLFIGYGTLQTRRGTLLAAAGQTLRAHEFHWSSLTLPPQEETAAYAVAEHPGRLEGFHRGNVLASYFHLHFGSHPDLAQNFVRACARFQAGEAAVPPGK